MDLLEALEVGDDPPGLDVEHEESAGVHVSDVEPVGVLVEALVVEAHRRAGERHLCHRLQNGGSRGTGRGNDCESSEDAGNDPKKWAEPARPERGPTGMCHRSVS